MKLDSRDIAKIECATVGDVLIISIIGEIDISNTPLLREQKKIIRDLDHKKVVFDLSQTKYVDSRGVATIIDIEAFVRSLGGILIVSSPQSAPEKIINILIPDSEDFLFPSLYDAMQYLERVPVCT